MIRLTAAAAATGVTLLLGLAAPASGVDANVDCPDATAATADCTNNVVLNTSPQPAVQYTIKFTITPNDILGGGAALSSQGDIGTG